MGVGYGYSTDTDKTAELAAIKSRLLELEARFSLVLIERQSSSPELILPAWDNATERALITSGRALAEGKGIQLSRVAQTDLIQCSATSEGMEIYMGSSLTGAPLVL